MNCNSTLFSYPKKQKKTASCFIGRGAVDKEEELEVDPYP